MNKPIIERLKSPLQVGDWHDKPVKWNVVWNNKNQMFSRKKDAEAYAKIWRKVGFKNEMEAINGYIELK